MTVRRMVLIGGAILLLAGVIALLVPISISNSDGNSLSCGSALAEDLSGPRAANQHSVAGVPILNQIVPHTDYVAQCQSAVSGRRAWSIPLAVVGLLVAGGSALVGRGRSASSP